MQRYYKIENIIKLRSNFKKFKNLFIIRQKLEIGNIFINFLIFIIEGIVSYGSYPFCAEGPAMYVRMNSYYYWILNTLQNE